MESLYILDFDNHVGVKDVVVHKKTDNSDRNTTAFNIVTGLSD